MSKAPTQASETPGSADAPALRWELRRFDSFAPAELYAVLRARVDVFVVEQQCPYPELDGRDVQALHLVAWDRQSELAAYARIVPPGARFEGPSIGRVLTPAAYRGKGLGRTVMRRAIRAAAEHYPGLDLQLSAQHHLSDFYTGLGFAIDSDVYDEDGIPHVDMRLAGAPGEA